MTIREALVLAAATLAVVRVTRFVTTDTLTLGLRLRVAKRFPRVGPAHWTVELVHCDWCVSVWVAVAAAVCLWAAGLLPDWRLVVLGWLAMAGAAGLLLDIARP